MPSAPTLDCVQRVPSLHPAGASANTHTTIACGQLYQPPGGGTYTCAAAPGSTPSPLAGARAQYKGTGTINGSGSYSFLLTVIDGQRPGCGGVDRFRLKVWGPGGVIQDNQMGDADGADASTTLGGGSIVIHKN